MKYRNFDWKEESLMKVYERLKKSEGLRVFEVDYGADSLLVIASKNPVTQRTLRRVDLAILVEHQDCIITEV